MVKLAQIKSRLIGMERDFTFFSFLESSIPVLLGTLIFFNPFPHTTSIREICFYLSAATAVVLVSAKRVTFSFKSPLSFPLILFVLWSFLSTIFALDIKNSIHDFYSHLVKYIVFYFIMINVFTSRRHIVLLSWIMVLSAAILSIGSIGYFYFMLENSLSNRLINFDQIPCNRSSLLAALAMVLSSYLLVTKIQLTHKALLVFCFLPLFALMMFTQTRGTLIALFVALILLFFRHRKIILAFLAVIVMVVAATPMKDRLFDMSSSHPRMSTNYLSIEILKDYPVKGIGFGMKIYGNHPLLSPEKYMSRIPSEYRQYEFFHVPHNLLLSVAVRTGLVGLGLFLYIMIAFTFMCWKLIVKGKDDFVREWSRCILSAFVLLFVAGLFEPVFNHLTETILFTVFGMGTILWRINQEGQQALPKTP